MTGTARRTRQLSALCMSGRNSDRGGGGQNWGLEGREGKGGVPVM